MSDFSDIPIRTNGQVMTAEWYNSIRTALVNSENAPNIISYANDAAYVSAKGSAAAVGDFYFNTTVDYIKVYDGAEWDTIVDQAYVDNAAGASDEVVVFDNGAFDTSVAASAMTIDLVQADGSTDPSTGTAAVTIGFRSSTLGDGGFNKRSITSALSVVIPSGATLGQTSAKAEITYLYALDNAGTVELAVSSFKYDDSELKTTVALSGASDGALTLYSTTQRTDVPIRLLGYFESTQATAGTWATNASTISSRPESIKEQVLAVYNTVTGQSFGDATPTVVDYNVVEIDTHSAVTGSGASWVFTAPREGVYSVSAYLAWSNITNLDFERLEVFVNGVSYKHFAWTFSLYQMGGSTAVPLNKGDTVAIVGYQDDSTSAARLITTTAGVNYVSICSL